VGCAYRSPGKRLRNGAGVTGSRSSSTSSSLGLRLFALGNLHNSNFCRRINARTTRHASWVAGLTWQRSCQPATLLSILFMPFRCISNGARLRRPVVALRLSWTHQSQSRVLQTAALDATTFRSFPKLCTPFHSFPKFHALTNSFNPRQPPMAALTQTQTRSHGGHSHHHHDNTYLTSTNKNDAGVRITRIGLYSNLGMAIAKGVGGYVFNSQSMIADAWHSLTDLASDILTLATVSWSLKPPTARFPTGFGKVESLGSLGVSGMLLFGGCFMCLNSCEILYAHFFLDANAAAEAALHSHGHSHSHAAIGPSLHAAWLAAGTVILKEWLYQASKCK